MNVKFMAARQDLLNLLDNAIARVSATPRHSEQEHASLRDQVEDLRSARDKVLALIVLADIV